MSTFTAPDGTYTFQLIQGSDLIAYDEDRKRWIPVLAASFALSADGEASDTAYDVVTGGDLALEAGKQWPHHHPPVARSSWDQEYLRELEIRYWIELIYVECGEFKRTQGHPRLVASWMEGLEYIKTTARGLLARYPQGDIKDDLESELAHRESQAEKLIAENAPGGGGNA